MVITIVTFLALIVVFGLYSILTQDNTESNDGCVNETGIRIKTLHPHGNDYVSFRVDYDGEFIRCDIVGTKFRNQSQLAKCVGEFEGMLVHDPDNQHSSQAVKVVHNNGTHLGYIPETYEGDRIRFEKKLPCRFHGILRKSDGGYFGIVVVPRDIPEWKKNK